MHLVLIKTSRDLVQNFAGSDKKCENPVLNFLDIQIHKIPNSPNMYAKEEQHWYVSLSKNWECISYQVIQLFQSF